MADFKNLLIRMVEHLPTPTAFDDD